MRQVFVSYFKLIWSKSVEVELEEKRKAGRNRARKKELTMNGEEERKGRRKGKESKVGKRRWEEG